MRWLGEEKDAVEERLFHTRRNLFTEVSLAFFHTASLYFEGHGGERIGGSPHFSLPRDFHHGLPGRGEANPPDHS